MQTFPSFIQAMEAIPDPSLRERLRELRGRPLVQTKAGLAALRREVAKLLHPDACGCHVAARALALFNARLDNFASIVAKGYELDTATNTWQRKVTGL